MILIEVNKDDSLINDISPREEFPLKDYPMMKDIFQLVHHDKLNPLQTAEILALDDFVYFPGLLAPVPEIEDNPEE